MAKIEVTSEVTGNVWKVQANVGDVLAEDDVIMILESMKMEIPVEAPIAGKLVELSVAEEDSVDEDQVVDERRDLIKDVLIGKHRDGDQPCSIRFDDDINGHVELARSESKGACEKCDEPRDHPIHDPAIMTAPMVRAAARAMDSLMKWSRIRPDREDQLITQLLRAAAVRLRPSPAEPASRSQSSRARLMPGGQSPQPR